MAWSPELLNRVSLVLARLDAIDNPPGKFVNRPANSLRQIHLLWIPQTYATLDQRLKALDLIRKREPAPSWKLMMGILPSDYDSSSPSPNPLWRDFTVDEVEVVTWPLIARGAAAVSERLLKDVGIDLPRWLLMINRISHLAPNREAVFTELEAVELRIKSKDGRDAMWHALRVQLHRHRQFPDAQWALPAEELKRLEAIYHRFVPADSLERIAWLFGSAVQLPNPPKEGWQAEEREIDQARQEAVLTVYREQGIDGVLGLVHVVTGGAGYVGKALCDAGAMDLEPLLEVAIRSEHAQDRDVAHGLVVCLFNAGGRPWAQSMIDRARAEAWGGRALLIILHALPQRRWVWDQAAAAGSGIDTAFWDTTPIWWIDEGEEAAYAIQKLIAAGRAQHALHLAGRERQVALPSALLLEVLRQSARQPPDVKSPSNDWTMFQHYVVEILTQLDKRTDVEANDLAGLEWAYLPLLTHSRRPAKVLRKGLSEQPSLFVEMIRAVFRPSEDSGYVDPTPENPDHARSAAHQAYNLLSECDRLPGQRDDGSINVDAMKAWVKDARAQAHAIGRAEVADDFIGKILSASPMGADGAWPAEPVREVLDLYRNSTMLEGFGIGKSNRRGVTTRMPRDGGQQERDLVAQYRAWSAVVGAEHPYTAKALDRLALRYEHDAQREDEQAARLDWET